MKIKISFSNLMVSLAIISAFLGSGISLGSIFGYAILPVRFMGLLCIMYILLNLFNNNKDYRKIQDIIFMVVYIVIVTLSFSENYNKSISLFIDYLVSFSIFCVIVLKVKDNSLYEKYTNLYIICVIFTIIICIYEYLTHNHIASNYTEAFSVNDSAYTYTTKAPTAFLYNPNNVAVLMIVSLPLFLEKMKQSLKIFEKIFWFIWAFLNIAVIFMTGSRGGLVAAILIFSIFILLSDISLNKKIFLIFMSIIIIIYFSDFIFDQLGYGGMLVNGKISFFAEGDGGRSGIARNSLKIVFLENPIFGLGVNSVENKGLISPHNTIIEVLCNYGIFGLCIFAFLLIRLFQMLISQNNKTITFLLFLSFCMSMFIPPTIMTLYVIFIPFALRIGKYYIERI